MWLIADLRTRLIRLTWLDLRVTGIDWRCTPANTELSFWQPKPGDEWAARGEVRVA